MNLSFCVLGRQPSIGLAELESLFGSNSVRRAGDFGAVLSIASDDIDINHLGGSIKVCRIIAQTTENRWPDIEKYIELNLNSYFNLSENQKNRLGISVYGLEVSSKEVLGLALRIKKSLKSKDISIRVVPNSEPRLNSAAVFHNKLTNDSGTELVIVRENNATLIAKTVGVQDINSYTTRDRYRPKRDSRVGMLPPKLAQIMINLAHPKPRDILLDPFCGTGVILQEAALTGLIPYGTDIDQRMVDFSKANLEWLKEKFGAPKSWLLEKADATKHKWQKFDSVASETYLGPPLFREPDQRYVDEISHSCNQLVRDFLANIGSQLKTGSQICLALPAWRGKNGQFHHLPIVDHLESMGYNLMSFTHVQQSELIYYRPGQFVGRELLVLRRK